MDAGESEIDTFWRAETRHGAVTGHNPAVASTHPRTLRRLLRRTHRGRRTLFQRIQANQGRHHVLDTVPASATAVNRTIILSKWRLRYRVRDDTHRYHLNLALDAGIGQRREHGFGFLNLRDKTPPRADT